MVIALIPAAYLLGAVPFGYLMARARGVDLFQAGSGNIGATNAGRVLGRKVGVLVFVLDFLKGAVPVAVAGLLDGRDGVRVAAGLAALLGHMFPVYLRFRGGKGVATGAGVLFVLAPGPAAFALLAWVATLAASRAVSLASIVCAVTVAAVRVAITPEPFVGGAGILTAFIGVAAALVIVRHRSNLRRLLAGTENRVPDTPAMLTLAKLIHVIPLALWLGAAVFFNLVAAPKIFESFKEVVDAAHEPPSDRTAGLLIAADLDDEQKARLASALAGAAVGPIFPVFFQLQAVCGLLVLVTAVGWSWSRPRDRFARLRTLLASAAFATVLVGWPLSEYVAELRALRLSPNAEVAVRAKELFATWHMVSLFLSLGTIALVLGTTALASKLPEAERPTPPPTPPPSRSPISLTASDN